MVKETPEPPKTAHWSGTGRMRGGRWGVWFFITARRFLGLRLTYALLVPPTIYFTFVSPDVPATMDFHRRVFGPQPWWKRRWLVFKHFFSFGRALIDRVAILGGDTRRFTFSFDGEHHLRDAIAEGHGVLLLTAHIGNWEVAGQLLSRLKVPINVTGFDHETTQVRSLLDQSSNATFRLLPLTGSPTDAIPLVAALRRGEVVVMLGDRAYGSKAELVPFLGDTARFPIGPHVMAAVAGAPLIAVFSLREPGGHYRFIGCPPQRPKLRGRAKREAYLRECVTGYVQELEAVLKRDPFQWYNFYPFWDQPPQSTPPQTIAEPCPSH